MEFFESKKRFKERSLCEFFDKSSFFTEAIQIFMCYITLPFETSIIRMNNALLMESFHIFRAEATALDSY